MTPPDLFTDDPELKAAIDELRDSEREPVYVRRGESVRQFGLKLIEALPDETRTLPDGSRAIVLDSKTELGPDTFTVRKLSCDAMRPDCIEVLAAKRDESGVAVSHCMLRVSRGGTHEFDFCQFARTFDFEPGTELSQEDRIDQFFYPLLEGDPVPGDEATRALEHDWDAELFEGSGRITV